MPRYARLHAPGAIFHIVSRFVDREFRFANTDERANYLARVQGALRNSDWTPIAYVLMSSHIHWVTVAGDRPSASFIHPLHSGFAAWLNREQDRLGPVFAERHSTILCDARHGSRVIAYVHNNPVRANLVADAADTTWSSHACYLGEATAPSWLDVELGLTVAGFDATPAGRSAFHGFVGEQRGLTRDHLLGEGDLATLRRRAREEVGAPVGISYPALEGDGERRLELVARGRPPIAQPWRGEPERVVALAARYCGLRPADVISSSRRREVSDARRLALLAWRDQLNRRQVEMATALGIGESAATALYRTAIDSRELVNHARIVAEFAKGSGE